MPNYFPIFKFLFSCVEIEPLSESGVPGTGFFFIKCYILHDH